MAAFGIADIDSKVRSADPDFDVWLEKNLDIIKQLFLGESSDEVWHEVGAVGEPAFENSWDNYGSNSFGDWSTAAFSKLGNWVQLKGFVAFGVVSLGDPIFTLPEGYRPVKVEMFASFTGFDQTPTGPTYILVHPDGRVIAHSSFLDDWVTITIPKFRTI